MEDGLAMNETYRYRRDVRHCVNARSYHSVACVYLFPPNEQTPELTRICAFRKVTQAT